MSGIPSWVSRMKLEGYGNGELTALGPFYKMMILSWPRARWLVRRIKLIQVERFYKAPRSSAGVEEPALANLRGDLHRNMVEISTNHLSKPKAYLWTTPPQFHKPIFCISSSIRLAVNA